MPPKAKIGEGIVVVLDVGQGVCAGTDPTFFTRAKDCLRFLLQRKIFADKCYDVVGIVTFGTTGTENQLATDDQYQHVTVLQEVRLVDWDMMKLVEDQGCGGSSGDWLDALVVAMDLLHDPDGKRFTSKKIVLITDFSGQFSEDKTKDIVAGFFNEWIDLIVIAQDGVKELNGEEEDGEAEQPGTSGGDKGSISKQQTLNWNGKTKSVVQMAGETVAARIVSKVDGMLCTFEEALAQLMFFEKKKQASAAWNTTLDIGSDLRIPITGRIKVRDVSLPTWRKDYKWDNTAVIESEVSYHLYDENQTAVPKEEVIDGFFYGTTLVPVSDEDMQMAYKSKSPRSMSVLGFTDRKNVPLRLRTGNQVLVVTARDKDEAAAMALSAIIQALVEMDMVAITRRVYSQNLNPRLGVMFPEITKDHECLHWIQIPYYQDVANVYLPSLQPMIDKLNTAEKDAMDQLIDAMDLSNGKEENGDGNGDDDEEELLNPTSVLNPQFQHYYNVLTYRALNPGAKLPEPPPHIQKILEPPEKVCEARDKAASVIRRVFRSQVTEPPKRTVSVSEADAADEKRPRIEGDLHASELVQHQVTRVTTASPSEDFIALLRERPADITHIMKQMEDVIVELMNSLAETSSGPIVSAMTDKIIASISTFRQECIRMIPNAYNQFLQTRFKNLVDTLSLNDVWIRFKEGSLGLITNEENLRSTVSREEANAFIHNDEKQKEAPPPSSQDDDYVDDMLENL